LRVLERLPAVQVTVIIQASRVPVVVILVEVYKVKPVVVNIHATFAGVRDVEVAITIDQGTR
jgi:hypothetical protein